MRSSTRDDRALIGEALGAERTERRSLAAERLSSATAQSVAPHPEGRSPNTFGAEPRPRTVIIGGNRTVFAPAYGSPFVRNLDEGRRYAKIEDFRNFVKLAYMATSLHHSGGTICEPVDLPVTSGISTWCTAI